MKAAQINYAGIVIATISIEGIKVILKLIKKYPLLLVLGLAVFVFLKDHPQGKIYSENIKKILKGIIPVEAIQKLSQVLILSDLYKKDIEKSATIHPKYYTLKQYAFRIIIETRNPIELKELQKRIIARGYRRKSAKNNSYLKKILKSDPNIEIVKNGKWMVSFKLIT
jgi:hypothetical protein